jgi:hypothetical protein
MKGRGIKRERGNWIESVSIFGSEMGVDKGTEG